MPSAVMSSKAFERQLNFYQEDKTMNDNNELKATIKAVLMEVLGEMGGTWVTVARKSEPEDDDPLMRFSDTLNAKVSDQASFNQDLRERVKKLAQTQLMPAWLQAYSYPMKIYGGAETPVGFFKASTCQTMFSVAMQDLPMCVVAGEAQDEAMETLVNWLDMVEADEAFHENWKANPPEVPEMPSWEAIKAMTPEARAEQLASERLATLQANQKIQEFERLLRRDFPVLIAFLVLAFPKKLSHLAGLLQPVYREVQKMHVQGR
jgi:hypothetical protein